jgi:Mrp family chromosome partitioning ATPase
VEDLAAAVAIGRLATQSVIVVSAGETRLSALSEIVREFEVSGIDCDGVLIISN